MAVQPESATRLRLGSHAWLILAPGASVETSEGGEYGWRSPGLGSKFPSFYIRVVERQPLPLVRWSVLDLAGAGELTVEGNRANYQRDLVKLSVSIAVEGNGRIKMVA